MKRNRLPLLENYHQYNFDLSEDTIKLLAESPSTFPDFIEKYNSHWGLSHEADHINVTFAGDNANHNLLSLILERSIYMGKHWGVKLDHIRTCLKLLNTHSDWARLEGDLPEINHIVGGGRYNCLQNTILYYLTLLSKKDGISRKYLTTIKLVSELSSVRDFENKWTRFMEINFKKDSDLGHFGFFTMSPLYLREFLSKMGVSPSVIEDVVKWEWKIGSMAYSRRRATQLSNAPTGYVERMNTIIGI